MDNVRYFPSLETLLPLENIPPVLGILKDSLAAAAGAIHYRDLLLNKSDFGDRALYDLTLVSYRKMALELPNTGGLALVAFPSQDRPGVSELPVTLYYQWRPLAYVERLSVLSMPSSAAGWIEALFFVLDVDPYDFLSSVIEFIYQDAEDPLESFVADFGLATLTLSTDPDVDRVRDLLLQFEQLDIDFKAWLIQHVVGISDDLSQQLEFIAELFERWTGIGSREELIAWFTPRIILQVHELDMALEFPRSWMVPMDALGQPIADPAVKSRIRFDLGGIQFDSKSGLQFLNPANLSMDRSEILNTGFVVGATDILLDLSPTANIAEAVADGRPDDFVGVYVGEASIAFPPSWFHDADNSTAEIFMQHMLLGTGGISGTVGLRTAPGGADPELRLRIGGDAGITVGFKQFDVTLRQNQFTQTSIAGFIEIPGLSDPAGNASRLDIAGRLTADGVFQITSSGQVYLGSGLWLSPDGDTPVLTLMVEKSATQTYTVAVAGKFSTPAAQGPGGFQSLQVAGELVVQRSASGIWSLQSFHASSTLQGDWRLPGDIHLTDFGVALDYDHAAGSFVAMLSGRVSLANAGSSIQMAAALQFNNFQDPTDVVVDAAVAIEQTLFFDQVGVTDAALLLHVETQPHAIGSLRVQGVGGIFPKAALPADWSDDDFMLSLTDLDSTVQFSAAGVQWTIASGDIHLPEAFGPDPELTDGAAPTIALSSSRPLVLQYQNGQLAVEGSFSLQSFGVSFGGDTAGTAFSAVVHNATLQFDGLSIPQLSEVSGQVRIPLPDRDPMDIAFENVAWDLQGLPIGTLRLEEDVSIPLGGGFEFIVRGGQTGGAIQTGLQISRSAGVPAWTLYAAMELVIPASILSGVDGDAVSMAAAGHLFQSLNDPIPAIQVTELQAGGTFHLGGQNGLLIENGMLRAEQLEHLFAPTPAAPFILALSGELVIDDGPRGGLQNARFSFTGDPLPGFDLDGVIVGSGDMELADGYLPVTVERLEIRFQPGLQLPEKLYPQNLTIITDAGINIQNILSGSVRDLTITFNPQGMPSVNLDGFHLDVEGLEMGSFILGGGLYVGGLQDIPDSLVMAGKLEGKMNGTGIMALAAFGVVDGMFAPLGAALAVDLGPAGIPLWATGILLTGASGGISFTGAMADPDDLKSYIQISDADDVTSTPRPDPEDEVEVAPANQVDTAPAAPAPAGETLAFACPAGPCPPPSVGILYEPHPDTEHYPDRIIFKFTALDKNQVDAILEQLDIPPAMLESMTPAAISSQIASEVTHLFHDTLPFLEDQLTTMETLMQQSLQGALQLALGNSASLYEALLNEAYKGLRAPNVNMKLTGTVSYTGISSFLSITGGVVISPTVQSAGIVGSLNLVGIPVGKFRGFLTMNNDQGLPDPAICGDLNVALGPLELGNLRMNIRYGLDVVEFSQTLVELAGSLIGPALGQGLRAVAPEAYMANGQDPAATLLAIRPEEALGLFGYLLPQDMSDEIRNFLVDVFEAIWDNFNPQMLLCGSAQPRIFGLPLGEELVGVSAQADKSSFAASFRFSPSALLAYCLHGILPPFDKMELGFQVALPDPKPLIAAGFGRRASLGAVGDFAEDAIGHLLDKAVGTLRYQIAPLGIPLADAQGRLIMPDLMNHPASPGRNHVRPEDQPGHPPSRKEIAIAALDAGVLSNVFWSGSTQELKALPGLSNPDAIGGMTLREDYFPHGGFVGAGSIKLPKILTGPPPVEMLGQLAGGTLAEKLNAAQSLLGLCTTMETLGRLSFYIPLPNPPLAGLQNGATPWELIQQIQQQGFGLNQLNDPEFYPLDEVFMQGFLGSETRPLTLLGIPIGYADMALAPPQGNQEGFFRVVSAIPSGSWLKQWVDSASLEFTMRRKPTRPIADLFQELSQAFQQSSNKTKVADQILSALTDELPKTALSVHISKLKMPPVLGKLLDLDANASGELDAYSPMYAFDTGFQTGTPLQTVRNFGGILLRVSGGLSIAKKFGLAIQDAAASFSLIPQGLNFPRVSGDISAAHIALPFGLPNLDDVRIRLDVSSSGSAPVLSSSSLSIGGKVAGAPLQLKLEPAGSAFILKGAMTMSWPLVMNTGAITEPVTGLKICEGISINSDLSGKFHVTFRYNAVPIGEIRNLSFKLNGRTYTLGTISVAQDIGSAAKLQQLFQEEITKKAYALFNTLYKDAETWLESLKRGTLKLNITDPAHFAHVIKAFGNTLDQAAILMARRFPSVKDVISGLFYGFSQNILEVLDSLAGAGFNNAGQIATAVADLFDKKFIEEVTTYLFNRWKNSWSNVARTLVIRLRDAGYTINQIAAAIKTLFSLQAIMDALYHAFGQNLGLVLNTIRQAGFTDSSPIVQAVFNLFGGSAARTLVSFLKQHWTQWSNPISAIADRLIGAGFPLYDVTDALKYNFGASKLNDITAALRTYWGSSLSSMKEIVDTLKALWGWNYTVMKDIAAAVLAAWGTGLTNIHFAAAALKNAWGSGDSDMENICKALKALIGSGQSEAGDIASALKYAWGSSYTDMKSITKALKNVFGSSETQMKTVAMALKTAWGSAHLDNITKALKNAWTGDPNLIDKLINALIFAFGSTLSQLTKIASALLAAGFAKAVVIAKMIAKGWSVPSTWP